MEYYLIFREIVVVWISIYLYIYFIGRLMYIYICEIFWLIFFNFIFGFLKILIYIDELFESIDGII